MDQRAPSTDVDRMVDTCMRLLMAFQRKEQLPRKFTDEDWEQLRRFEGELEEFMRGAGAEGEAFLTAWRCSPLVVRTPAEVINTLELKRCLKMLVAFRDQAAGGA